MTRKSILSSAPILKIRVPNTYNIYSGKSVFRTSLPLHESGMYLQSAELQIYSLIYGQHSKKTQRQTINGYGLALLGVKAPTKDNAVLMADILDIWVVGSKSSFDAHAEIISTIPTSSRNRVTAHTFKSMQNARGCVAPAVFAITGIRWLTSLFYRTLQAKINGDAKIYVALENICRQLGVNSPSVWGQLNNIPTAQTIFADYVAPFDFIYEDGQLNCVLVPIDQATSSQTPLPIPVATTKQRKQTTKKTQAVSTKDDQHPAFDIKQKPPVDTLPTTNNTREDIVSISTNNIQKTGGRTTRVNVTDVLG